MQGIPHHVDDRLENWARAVRDGKNFRSSCGSAEGKYRPKTDESDDQPRGLPVDYEDAQAVERALTLPSVPEIARRMIVLHYVRRFPAGAITRICGIPRGELDARFLWAVRITRLGD